MDWCEFRHEHCVFAVGKTVYYLLIEATVFKVIHKSNFFGFFARFLSTLVNRWVLKKRLRRIFSPHEVWCAAKGGGAEVGLPTVARGLGGVAPMEYEKAATLHYSPRMRSSKSSTVRRIFSSVSSSSAILLQE